MPADAFRPRSISELLDASIQLFRAHYSELLVMSMIALLPQAAASTYNLVVLVPRYGDRATLYSLPIALITLVWFVLADSALLTAASDAYLGLGIDRRKAFRQALSKSGTIILSAFLKYLLISLGFMAVMIAATIVAGIVGALVVGIAAAVGGGGLAGARTPTSTVIVGIVVAVLFAAATAWWMLVTFARLFAYRVAIVLERLGASASLHRSSNLVRGSSGKVVLTFLLVYVIYGAAYALFGAVTYAASSSFVAAQSAIGVLAPFIYPIIPIVTTLLYYDLRIRKEGYDIELMAGELESGLAMRDAGSGMREATGSSGGALVPEAVPHPASRIPHP